MVSRFQEKKSFIASFFCECRSHHSCPPKPKANESEVEQYVLKYTILSVLISESAKMYLKTKSHLTWIWLTSYSRRRQEYFLVKYFPVLRTVEREMKDRSRTWGHLERQASERNQWRSLVEALYASMHEHD